jgi:hypothetical protein
MRKSVVVHNQHAWRSHRTRIASSAAHGSQLFTIEQLAARLAGGFVRPIDPETFKAAVGMALANPLGDLDVIKELPGFHRAAASSLAKAWSAGVSLSEESLSATEAETKARLGSLALLEKNVLAQLPSNQFRPQELVEAATKRLVHASSIFGRIEIRGSTEVPPVWRPLISMIAKQTEVVWIAEARYVPAWVIDAGVKVERVPAAKPTIQTISCASPRHEILEAFRWARQHLAKGARPEDIAIAAASPDGWDDHVLALAESSNLTIHFVHGRAALANPEGQLDVALAEILLRGFSRRRVIRFISLVRSQTSRFKSLHTGWWRGLSEDSPLLDAPHWERAISALKIEGCSDAGEHQLMLREIINTLSKGLDKAGQIGQILLEGRALAIWRKALMEGPPAALDVTLMGIRVDDGVEPETAILWTPASALASVTRPLVWLVGLTSRSWPRRASEDPLLPAHVIAAERLDPLPIHQADRRDFVTICDMTSREVMISRARRDGGGRLNGASPLYPRDIAETYYARSRQPDHAASSSDRYLARPAEFATLPLGVSALQTWIDWYQAKLTAHDGLIRSNHPVLLRALNRRQSATSLVKLLRDPLGYLWTYGFGWSEPEETDEPLTLDALAFGSLLHEILEDAVTQIELAQPGSFGRASRQEISEVIQTVAKTVDTRWNETRPIPPPAVWKRKLAEAAELALVALSHHDDPLPDERSWAEVPFGGDRKAETLTQEVRSALPWDPVLPVAIPGTNIMIGGSIDRLDLAGDGTRARVTDYKSGKAPHHHPQLKQGAELQRCLYAYAVKALVNSHPEVEAQLLYPRRDGHGLQLEDPDGTLARLVGYLLAASGSFAEGAAFSGPSSNDEWYDLAFALPGGAKEGYLTIKSPLVAQALAAFSPLWEEV